MLTCVDFELPLAVKHLDKLRDDKVVLDQLLANVERNRVKWRNDLSSDTLSVQRRIALQSVKDKLDD